MPDGAVSAFTVLYGGEYHGDAAVKAATEGQNRYSDAIARTNQRAAEAHGKAQQALKDLRTYDRTVKQKFRNERGLAQQKHADDKKQLKAELDLIKTRENQHKGYMAQARQRVQMQVQEINQLRAAKVAVLERGDAAARTARIERQAAAERQENLAREARVYQNFATRNQAGRYGSNAPLWAAAAAQRSGDLAARREAYEERQARRTDGRDIRGRANYLFSAVSRGAAVTPRSALAGYQLSAAQLLALDASRTRLAAALQSQTADAVKSGRAVLLNTRNLQLELAQEAAQRRVGVGLAGGAAARSAAVFANRRGFGTANRADLPGYIAPRDAAPTSSAFFGASGAGRRGGGRFDTSNSVKSFFGASLSNSAIFSAAAPVLAGILVGRAIRGGVRAVGDYENAVVDLRKVLKGAADEQERVVASVTRLADSMPNTREELLKMAAAGAQMGVAGKDIAAFTQAMQMLISAAPSITEEHSLQFGQTRAFLGSGIGFQQLAGVITELGNTQPATEERILELIHQVSGGLGTLRRQAGFSEGDVAGIGGYLASVGARPESARTTIREWSQEWLEALAGATEKMEAFEAVTGRSEEELRAMSSTEVLGRFLEGMNELGVSSKALLDVINLDGDRALAVLAAMGLRVEDYYKSVESANEQVINGGQAVAEEFTQRAETMTARFQKVNNWWAAWTESSGPAASFLASAYEFISYPVSPNAPLDPLGGRHTYTNANAAQQSAYLNMVGGVGRPLSSFGEPPEDEDALDAAARQRTLDKVVNDRDARRLGSIGILREMDKARKDLADSIRAQKDETFALTQATRKLQEAEDAWLEEDDDEEKAEKKKAFVAALAEQAKAVQRLADAEKKRAEAAAEARGRDARAAAEEAQARFWEDEERAEWLLTRGGTPYDRANDVAALLERRRQATLNLTGGRDPAQLKHRFGGVEQSGLNPFEQDRYDEAVKIAERLEQRRLAALNLSDGRDPAQMKHRYGGGDAARPDTFLQGWTDALDALEQKSANTAEVGKRAFEGFGEAIGDVLRAAVEDGKISLDALGSYFLNFAINELVLPQILGTLGAALGPTASVFSLTGAAAGGVSQGGMMTVGEQGREIVHLPRGSRVYSRMESEAMLARSGRGGGFVQNVNITVPGDFGTDPYAARIIEDAVARGLAEGAAAREMENFRGE